MFESGKLKRFSKDEARINRYSVQLIEFCKAPGLLIVNGRIGRGKGIGDFTRDDTTGRNIDDYMICNPELFSIIDNFTIEPRVPESDHRGWSLKLTCNSIRNSRTAPNWTLHKRFIWSNDGLHYMNVVIKDDQSQNHRQVFLDVLVDLSDTNEVAGLFSLYLSQAIERVCRISKPTGRAKSNGAPWFYKECKEKRSPAIQAVHRVECNADREMHMVACKNDRALKHRKRR